MQNKTQTGTGMFQKTISFAIGFFTSFSIGAVMLWLFFGVEGQAADWFFLSGWVAFVCVALILIVGSAIEVIAEELFR